MTTFLEEMITTKINDIKINKKELEQKNKELDQKIKKFEQEIVEKINEKILEIAVLIARYQKKYKNPLEFDNIKIITFEDGRRDDLYIEYELYKENISVIETFTLITGINYHDLDELKYIISDLMLFKGLDNHLNKLENERIKCLEDACESHIRIVI